MADVTHQGLVLPVATRTFDSARGAFSTPTLMKIAQVGVSILKHGNTLKKGLH